MAEVSQDLPQKCGSCAYFVQSLNQCEMNGFSVNADDEACRFFSDSVTMEESGVGEDPESEDACSAEEDETPGGIYVKTGGDPK